MAQFKRIITGATQSKITGAITLGSSGSVRYRKRVRIKTRDGNGKLRTRKIAVTKKG